MDILVTGGTGFVGARLCRRLVRDGHRVMVFHRPSSDLSLLRGLSVQCVTGDLTDEQSVKRAVRGHDAVIHAAGNVSQSAVLEDLRYRVNVVGTRSVVAGCVEGAVGRLVYVSSVAAIGISSNRRHSANETLPFNLEQSGLTYHLSKKRAEDEVHQAVARGLDAVIVNPSSICGPHGRYFRGSEVSVKVLRNRIVPYFMGGRSVVHVDDVVEGIIAALHQGRTGERYILGGENLTWRKMSEISAEVFHLRRVFVPVPPFVTAAAALAFGSLGTVTGRRPRISYAVHYAASRCWFYDSGKAGAELGYRPRPYRQIVEDYSRFRERPS